MGKGKNLYWREEDIIIIVIIVLSYLSYVIFSDLICLTLSNLNIKDLTTINFKKDNFYSSETSLDKFYTVHVIRGNDLSYDRCKKVQERPYRAFQEKG